MGLGVGVGMGVGVRVGVGVGMDVRVGIGVGMDGGGGESMGWGWGWVGLLFAGLCLVQGCGTWDVVCRTRPCPCLQDVLRAPRAHYPSASDGPQTSSSTSARKRATPPPKASAAPSCKLTCTRTCKPTTGSGAHASQSQSLLTAPNSSATRSSRDPPRQHPPREDPAARPASARAPASSRAVTPGTPRTREAPAVLGGGTPAAPRLRTSPRQSAGGCDPAPAGQPPPITPEPAAAAHAPGPEAGTPQPAHSRPESARAPSRGPLPSGPASPRPHGVRAQSPRTCEAAKAQPRGPLSSGPTTPRIREAAKSRAPGIGTAAAAGPASPRPGPVNVARMNGIVSPKTRDATKPRARATKAVADDAQELQPQNDGAAFGRSQSPREVAEQIPFTLRSLSPEKTSAACAPSPPAPDPPAPKPAADAAAPARGLSALTDLGPQKSLEEGLNSPVLESPATPAGPADWPGAAAELPSSWECNECFVENFGSDECTNCGAERVSGLPLILKASPQPWDCLTCPRRPHARTHTETPPPPPPPTGPASTQGRTEGGGGGHGCPGTRRRVAGVCGAWPALWVRDSPWGL